MAEDEGRLVPSKEARTRKAIRKVKFGDQPKTKIQIEPLVKSTYKSPYERAYVATIEAGTRRNPSQSVAKADFVYRPQNKDIKVNTIFPQKQGSTTFDTSTSSFQAAHRQAANKVLSTSATKDLITKTARMFPNALVLEGDRSTGLRKIAQAKQMSKIGHRGIKQSVTQRFNLEGLRKRAGRLGKAGKVLGLGLAAYDVVRNLNKE
jgi:hypothetical protein